MDVRFASQTVFITGAARGQGRSHAVAFAQEGANLALSDICADLDTVPYRLSRAEDLAETVRLCQGFGGKVISAPVDVRDFEAVKSFADQTLETFDQIDVTVTNAGVFGFARLIDMTPEQFDELLDTNLKGTWHTIKATVPSMVERRYGRVIVIGSTASLIGMGNIGHYVAAKHGVLGLTKALAMEHGADGITVNCVCPSSVRTTMLENDAARALMSPGDPSIGAAEKVLASINAIPKPYLDPKDVTDLVMFLASNAARHITGAAMRVDMGATIN